MWIMSNEKLERFEDSEGWRWYKDSEGRFYISVTKVLDVAQHQRMMKYYKTNSKAKNEKVLKTTANIGTEIHDLVERDLNNETFDIPEKYQDAFSNWIDVKDKFKIEAMHTEQMVISKKYGFAGTLDMFIEGDFKKKYNIADLKTGFYGVKAGWQMAAYREAFLEQGGYSPDEVGMVGIQIHRDGSKVGVFEYEHINPCTEAFLSCLEIFKMLYFNKLNKLGWSYLKDNSLKRYWGVPNEDEMLKEMEKR